MRISLHVEGGDKLERALRELPNRVSRSVQREALLAGGETIRALAERLAPREPGTPDLAENIVMSNTRPDDGSVGIAIGPSRGFFYGFFQEFGTVHHGAQPFMRPAFDSGMPRALKIITAEMWAALVKRGFGSGRGAGGGSGL